MPKLTVSVACPATPSRVAQLLRDLDFLGATIPDVVSVERLSDTAAVWTVRTKVGPLYRTLVFRGDLQEATEARIRFHADAKEATIDGVIDLAADGPHDTRVTLTLETTGKGPLGSIIDNILRSRLDHDAERFAARLTERFRTGASS